MEQFLTWFPIVDISKNEDAKHNSDKRCHPVDQEHDSRAEEGSDQGTPLVVVLERRTPTYME